MFLYRCIRIAFCILGTNVSRRVTFDRRNVAACSRLPFSVCVLLEWNKNNLFTEVEHSAQSIYRIASHISQLTLIWWILKCLRWSGIIKCKLNAMCSQQLNCLSPAYAKFTNRETKYNDRLRQIKISRWTLIFARRVARGWLPDCRS